jgi:hypothetical protein
VAYFDRFDICEAYLAIEWDWHAGGWLRERPSNARRLESTDVQLHRMGFRPGVSFRGYGSLEENGKEIYRALVLRYGFRPWTARAISALNARFDAIDSVRAFRLANYLDARTVR